MSTSVSSVTDNFFTQAQNGFTTSLASTVSSGAATVPLNSVAGYTNGQPAVFVVDPTDSSKKQTFTGIIDTAGVQVTGVVWTAGTNQSHAGGATVVDYWSATHWDMLQKGLLVNHEQSGGHKTLTDDSGNEWIKQTSTASAVNEITVANAATGDGPIISATGDDTDINITLSAKGSGVIASTSDVQIDHILEKTSGHGVNIDGLLIKDGVISNPYKARAYANGDQTVNGTNVTKVTLGAESYDPNNNFASSGYTVPVTGYYQVNANFYIVDTDGKIVTANAYIYKNSAPVALSILTPAVGSNTMYNFSASISDILYLAADDVITLYVKVDTTDSGTFFVKGTNTNLSIHLLSV